MKTPAYRGFTIIEVMLFLAISGVMVAALLGGWTLMINTQRYKDSVDTVYGYIQDQYNLVYNVENERSTSLSCADAQITEGGVGSPRGQSDCVLMGRYVKVTDGAKLRSYAVVGREPTGGVSGTDTEQIRQYRPTVVAQSIGLTEVEQSVPWGAVLQKPGIQTGWNGQILLLRSPGSGVVHRYVVEGGRMDPSITPGDINTVHEAQAATFCFDAGVPVQGGKQVVVIGAYASSRNSVETKGSDNGC